MTQYQLNKQAERDAKQAMRAAGLNIRTINAIKVR